MTKFDVHQAITDQIVAAIEEDIGSVQMPWHRGTANQIPVNVHSGNEYNGINVLNLWIMGHLRKYSSSLWGTYRQWQNVGGQVKKGEKSSIIVFYKQLKYDDANGDEVIRPVARAYWGFNADQVDGFEIPRPEWGDPIERNANADQYTSATGAKIVHESTHAYYRGSTDTIHMPPSEAFNGTDTSTPEESYYAVLLHELAHWTGVPKRLDRNMFGRFGSQAYAMEELVAELTSAFQCAHLGITSTPRLDHAQYIKNWLKVLKNDKKAIFTAASKAQEAVDYLDQAA